MPTFVRDFLASWMGVAIPMFIAYRMLDVVAWPQVALEPIAPALTPLHLVYLVPIGLIVAGVRRRRFGLIAGPVAFAVLIQGWTYMSLLRQAETIDALELAPSDRRSADNVVLPTARDCDRLCIEIAAGGRRDVWIPDGDAWQSWRATRGAKCDTDERLRATRLAFSLAGYPGWCAHRNRDSEVGDAFVIAEYQLTGAGALGEGADWAVTAGWLPSSDQPDRQYNSVAEAAMAVRDFVGTMHVVSWRPSAHEPEKLIARRLAGVLTSPAERLGLWFVAGPIEITPDFRRIDFARAALGIRLPQPEIARFAYDITELEKLEQELAHADFAKDFPSVRNGDDWRQRIAVTFAERAAAMPPTERSATRARTVRLLASDSALMVMAGLLTLVYEDPQDAVFAKQQVLALLGSDNPAIVAIVAGRVREGFAAAFADDADVKRAIVEIAFRGSLFEDKSPLARWATPYAYSTSYPDFDPAVRARVRTFLADRDRISKGQCRALLKILGTGGSRQIDEALEVVAALPTQTFAPCSAYLGMLRALGDKEARGALLTPTLATVIARGKDLPISDLDDFWMGVTVSKEDRRATAPIFLGMLAERLAVAQHANDGRGVVLLSALRDRVQYFVAPENK
jgi:hypothetical protein